MKFSSAPSAHSFTFDDLVGKFRAAICAYFGFGRD